MNIGGVDIGRDGQREGWTEGGIERGRYGHPSLCPFLRMYGRREGQREGWREGGMGRGMYG